MTSYANLHINTDYQLTLSICLNSFIGNDINLTGNASDIYVSNEAPVTHNMLHYLSHLTLSI